jgi:hypothetical protein
MQAQSALLQCVLVSLTFLSAAQTQQVRGSLPAGQDSQSTPDLEAIIRNMEAAQEASRPQLPFEAVRDYRLFEGDASRINAEVVARITFMPPNVKNYSIQNHTGSSRGADVVRRILDKEASMTAQDPDASLRSISSQNYNFAYLGEDQLNDRPCYKLKINPKRKDISLIDGEIWVDKGSFLIPRIEGDMSKTPSWWLKRVHLVLDFGSFGGTWQQTGTQALADVRMLGKRSLVSKVLDYREGEALALQREPAGLQARGVPRRRARPATFSLPRQ